VVAELSILLRGEKRPIILHASVNTAVLVVAHTDEFARAPSGSDLRSTTWTSVKMAVVAPMLSARSAVSIEPGVLRNPHSE